MPTTRYTSLEFQLVIQVLEENTSYVNSLSRNLSFKISRSTLKGRGQQPRQFFYMKSSSSKTFPWMSVVISLEDAVEWTFSPVSSRGENTIYQQCNNSVNNNPKWMKKTWTIYSRKSNLKEKNGNKKKIWNF